MNVAWSAESAEFDDEGAFRVDSSVSRPHERDSDPRRSEVAKVDDESLDLPAILDRVKNRAGTRPSGRPVADTLDAKRDFDGSATLAEDVDPASPGSDEDASPSPHDACSTNTTEVVSELESTYLSDTPGFLDWDRSSSDSVGRELLTSSPTAASSNPSSTFREIVADAGQPDPGPRPSVPKDSDDRSSSAPRESNTKPPLTGLTPEGVTVVDLRESMGVGTRGPSHAERSPKSKRIGPTIALVLCVLALIVLSVFAYSLYSRNAHRGDVSMPVPTTPLGEEMG